MARDEALLGSVVEAIGATPLVALGRLTQGMSGRLLAKLEYLSPGFSTKDRFARQAIEEARSDGRLKPGQTVVELTSGNTGTGLAIVCAVLGHPFVAVMSRGNSEERARMMAALGAEVVLVEQALGSPRGQVSGADLALVEQATQRLVAERGAFRADQFLSAANRRAHELHTGPELWAQSGGTITVFCSFAGTGGSFAGIAAALRARNPAIRCYVVEPAGAAALAGKPVTHPNHRIQGGGYAMNPLPQLDSIAVDGFIEVTDEEAAQTARRLARTEGIFGGYSSGANVAAALKLLQGAERGGTVATLIVDSGLKYLSTDLWS